MANAWAGIQACVDRVRGRPANRSQAPEFLWPTSTYLVFLQAGGAARELQAAYGRQ